LISAADWLQPVWMPFLDPPLLQTMNSYFIPGLPPIDSLSIPLTQMDAQENANFEHDPYQP
jgi:hypothetical protein